MTRKYRRRGLANRCAWPAAIALMLACSACQSGLIGRERKGLGDLAPSGETPDERTEAGDPTGEETDRNDDRDPDTSDDGKEEGDDGSSPAASQCASDERGTSETQMRRLTTPEIVRSLDQVFGSVMQRDAVTKALAIVPQEIPVAPDQEFDNRIPNVEQLEALARAIAHEVVTDPDAATAVLGCDIQADVAACRQQVLDQLVRRLFRRPLTSEEQESYTAFMMDIGGVDGIEWAIVRALVAPHFHQHVEIASTSNGDGRERIDAFAIASRVAFALTGALPDEALLTAAEKGELETLEDIRAQAERLIDTDGAREQLRLFVREWLRISPPDPSPAVATLAGLEPGGLGAEASEEFDRYVDYMVFEQQASFQDLVASPVVFPTTDRLATLYGVATDNGPVQLDAGVRGLFFRAANLLTSQTETSPIVRGATFRRQVLCEVFPTPDPDLVAAGQEIAASLARDEYSTRERAELTTADAACQGCHGRINPVGYLLERFGPMGEWRDEETVIDSGGEVIATFSIDPHVDDVGLTETDELDGPEAFAAALADSEETRACFAGWVFAASRARFPESRDACLVEELVGLMQEGASVREVFLGSVVNEDVFYRAEVAK